MIWSIDMFRDVSRDSFETIGLLSGLPERWFSACESTA